jgi:outer membrane protein TolC
VLDAQRSHFAARQSLTTLRYARLAAQIQLYAALGGGAEDEKITQENP